MGKKQDEPMEIIERWMEKDLSRALESGELPEAFSVDRTLGQIQEIIGAGRHPLLSGESGVGKTAVIYELLRRSRAGGGPLDLSGRRVVQISFKRFASTLKKPHEQMRPEMQRLVAALLELEGAVIPFFRDIHLAYDFDLEPQLQMLAFQLSAPVLCEGMRSEVMQLLEATPELEQFFITVDLKEPELEEAKAVLRQWAEAEGQNGVRFTEGAVDEALYLTHRFLARDRLPRKAIDLLRQTACTAGDKVDGPAAIERFSAHHSVPRFLVDPEIPLDLDEVEERFRGHVLGQDEAVRTIVQVIGIIKAGLSDMRRPFGSFLFVGPTGVGKTHLAQYLAAYLFGSRDRMVRLNMADFQGERDALTLFGDPEDNRMPMRRGMLTQRLMGQPFAVLLLDEFEKAHQRVHDRFLQLIDEGEYINGAAETVACRSLIIIATSNTGAEVYRGKALGFTPATDMDSMDREVDRVLEKTFRFEFINRFDRVVHFHPLGREEIRSIARRELLQLQQRTGLRQRGLALDVEESVLDWLTVNGYDQENGARFLRRVMERYVTTQVADAIVRHGAPNKRTISLRVRARQIRAVLQSSPSARGREREAVVVPEGTAEKTVSLNREALLEKVDELRKESAPWIIALEEKRVQASALLERINAPGFWESPERRETLEAYRALDVSVRQETRLSEPLLELFDKMTQSEDTPSALSRLAELYRASARALVEWEQRSREDSAGVLWLAVSAADPLSPAADLIADLVALELAWCRKVGLDAAIAAYAMTEGVLSRAVIEVEGPGASAYLEMEAGIHRKRISEGADEKAIVQLIPRGTETDDRILQTMRRKRGLLGLEVTQRIRIRVPALGIGFDLLGADAGTLGELAPDLTAHLNRPAEEMSVARVYGEDGAVRDPRTGVSSGRIRDVWKGRLDKFLEGWRRAQRSPAG